MQRFFTLVALLLLALPVGLSVTGCTTNVSAYCNDAGYGPKLTAITQVLLSSTQSTEGISLAYGQIGQVGTPTAKNCKGTTLTTGSATYGSSNLTFADMSPTGAVCGGTWNRTSAGGIPDFTICTPPTAGGTATVTASLGGVASNPVLVYVHPQISAITIAQPTDCILPGSPGGDLVQSTEVYGPDGALIGSGANVNSASAITDVGTVTFTPQTPSVVTINNTSVIGETTVAAGTAAPTASNPNGYTQANQPGGTVITATIAGTGSTSVGTSSAAGYFYTCPPSSIALSLPSSTGATSSNGNVTVTQGNPQTLTSVITVTDPQTQATVALTPISGAGPDFTSTQPEEINVTSAGVVSNPSGFPGTATISGICQPGTPTSSTATTSSSSSTATGLSCNPTPLNVLGTYGTGLPIVANPITVTSPGVDSTLVWAASPDSQLFTPFDLSQGTGGTPILLPYPPNSMVIDPTGTDLYFGTYRELMVVSTTTNTVSTQDTTVPGVVLAVSPSNNQVVIADQLRKVIYLYTPSTTTTTAGGTTGTTTSSVISTGGVATHAVYSPDGKNVYITGPTALYVHNIVSGWSSYPLTAAADATSCTLDNTNSTPFCSPDVALTVPSVAVFLGGAPITARSFCPDTTTTPVTFNPLAATITGTDAQHVAATSDGTHILGASTTQLSDIEHAPTSGSSRVIAPAGPCPGIATPAGALAINTTLRQLALTGITPTQIDQVLTSPDASHAFITYAATAATGLLPLYTPSSTAGGTGTLTNVQLSSGAEAPIAGAFSPDSSLFFVSTTGDNLIHVISTGTAKETETLKPSLTNTNGQTVPAQFIVAKPRLTT